MKPHDFEAVKAAIANATGDGPSHMFLSGPAFISMAIRSGFTREHAEAVLEHLEREYEEKQRVSE